MPPITTCLVGLIPGTLSYPEHFLTYFCPASCSDRILSKGQGLRDRPRRSEGGGGVGITLGRGDRTD